jgi:16S rRNA (guanine966-N2)-methyltransferase
VLRENIAALGVAERSQVVVGKTASELAQLTSDIVFLDPPYELAKEYEACLGTLGENPPPLVVVQHSRKYDPGEAHGRLHRDRTLRQGDNSLSFYRS